MNAVSAFTPNEIRPATADQLALLRPDTAAAGNPSPPGLVRSPSAFLAQLLNFTPTGVISETVPNNFSERSRGAFSPSASVRARVRWRWGICWRKTWGGDLSVTKPNGQKTSQLVHLVLLGRRRRPFDEGQRLLDHRGRGRGRRLGWLGLGWLGRPIEYDWDHLFVVSAVNWFQRSRLPRPRRDNHFCQIRTTYQLIRRKLPDMP
jgi:hypothetical protein